MTEHSNHPQKQKLFQYVEETLSAEEARSIAGHLQNCEVCQRELNSLKTKLGNQANTTVGAGIPTVLSPMLAPTLPPADPQQNLAGTLLHSPTKEAPSRPPTTVSAVQTDTVAPMTPPPTVTFMENAGKKANDNVGGSIGPYQLEAKLDPTKVTFLKLRDRVAARP